MAKHFTKKYVNKDELSITLYLQSETNFCFTSLHMLYQEFNLYILRVSRSLCSNTRKVVPNPSSFFLVDFVSKFSSSNLVVIYLNIQVVRLYAMHIIIKLVCDFHIIAISRRNFLAMVSKRQLHIQNLETKNKLVSEYPNLWLVLNGHGT